MRRGDRMNLVRTIGAALLPVGLLTSGCAFIGLGPLVEDVIVPAVEVTTPAGAFTIALDIERSPQSAAFFVANIRNGVYNDVVVYRATAGARIEAGGFDRGLVQKATRPPIQNESDNGLSNLRGTVAMARASNPDSAASQFFVNLVDNAQLDAIEGSPGYAVFGRVVTGLDVFDRIAALPTGDRSGLKDVPTEDIVITLAARDGGAAAAPRVRFETTAGDFTLELDATAAPLTTANVLQYVDDGFYVGTLFHRVVPGFVVQGGGFERGLSARPGPTLNVNEASADNPNVRGSVALLFDAEAGLVTPRFAISLAQQPDLDPSEEQFGNPVFGWIVGGSDVVEALASAAVIDQGGLVDVPIDAIVIQGFRETEFNTGEQQLSADGRRLVAQGRATAYNFARETFLALIDGFLAR